jgi:hypothetical protein
LREIDATLREWLRVAFNPDCLQIKRVTYDGSSGLILENIARGESVHAVRTLSELKKRLDFNGRHCYAVFHHALPNRPLAFIHVAFTPELATSMTSIHELSTFVNPKFAVFYSVNALEPALGGLDLPKRLILLTAAEVRRQFPTIQTAVTLSPIPNFKKWATNVLAKSPGSVPWPKTHYETLRQLSSMYPISSGRNGSSSTATTSSINGSTSSGSSDGSTSSSTSTSSSSSSSSSSPDAWLLAILSTPSPTPWTANPTLCAALQAPLTWLCCHYLLHAKVANKKADPETLLLPYDPVERFHVRNGASVHRVDWMANASVRGLESSLGMMVNYLYFDERDVAGSGGKHAVQTSASASADASTSPGTGTGTGSDSASGTGTGTGTGTGIEQGQKASGKEGEEEAGVNPLLVRSQRFLDSCGRSIHCSGEVRAILDAP